MIFCATRTHISVCVTMAFTNMSPYFKLLAWISSRLCTCHLVCSEKKQQWRWRIGRTMWTWTVRLCVINNEGPNSATRGTKKERASGRATSLSASISWGTSWWGRQDTGFSPSRLTSNRLFLIYLTGSIFSFHHFDLTQANFKKLVFTSNYTCQDKVAHTRGYIN